jgi:hypothetical protein
MAAKKKLSTKALRDLVLATREKFKPCDDDTIEEAGQRSIDTIASYEALGLGANITKLVPLQAFLREHASLVVPAGKPWADAEIAKLVKAVGGTALPPTLERLLRQGGLRAFRAHPDERIETFDLERMLAIRSKMRGMLDMPPQEEGQELDASSIGDWKYPLAGTLPTSLRANANLLPICPYDGDDYGAYFVPLHIRDSRNECPVLLGIHGFGDVVVYGRDVAAWQNFMVTLTLKEIDWMMAQ